MVNDIDLFYVYQCEQQSQSNSYSPQSQTNDHSQSQQLVNTFRSGDIYQLIKTIFNNLMKNDLATSQAFFHKAFDGVFVEGDISPKNILMKIARFLSILL